MEIMGYWDSGNQLRDPYNHRPVCILSRHMAAKILNPKKDRVHFIPYCSLGQKEGLLPVTEIACIKIQNGRHEVEIRPAAVGIANEGLLEGKEYDIYAGESGKEEQNMIMRLVLPRYEKVHFLSGICSLFLRKEDEVHYIGGAEILPPPLEGEREAYCIRMLDGVHAERARKELIEHNLRLVVYIAKKFDNTGVGVEDLISIGTIGLIKGINTFNPDKNIKLATYASRCIENEILMYLRRNSKTKLEVSIDEPLNVDWDGNALIGYSGDG